MEKHNTTKIYLVTNCYGDPNKVYIGKTKNCRKYIHKITYGKQIEYIYIDEINSLSHEDWKPLECFWIEYFKFLGFNVLNKNEGGGGVDFRTEESIKLQIKRQTGKIQSKETCQKRSESLLGRNVTWGDKISKGKKGIKKSEEIKKRMSECKKGREIKWKEKISKSLIGKKKSKEHILNMGNKVIQYDLNMNFIQEWESCISIINSKIICSGVLFRSLKGIISKKSKYIWKYKTIRK